MTRRIKPLSISWFLNLEQPQGSQPDSDALIPSAHTVANGPCEGSEFGPLAGCGDDSQLDGGHRRGLDLSAIGTGLASAPVPVAHAWRALEEQTATDQRARDASDAGEWGGRGLPSEPAQSLRSSVRQGSPMPSQDSPGTLCRDLVAETVLDIDPTQGMLSDTPILDLGLTFQLSSRPATPKTIYLDFNGHTTTGTAWNDATMGSSFYSASYSFDGSLSA